MKLRRGPALVFFLVAGAAHADSWLPEQAAVRHVTLLGGSGFSRLIATQASIGLDLDRLNRDQLLLEKRRLEDDLPGLGGPIAITAAVGGGGIAVGSFYLFLGLSSGLGSSFIITLAEIAFVVGGLGIAAGVVWLVFRIMERGPIQEQIKQVEMRLNQVYEKSLVAPQPPRDDYPPPPPPPPPATELGPNPVPMVMVARF